MTWNPRDLGHHRPGSEHLEIDPLFRLPDPPLPGSGIGNPAPYLPTATPTVAEAMGWGSGEDLDARLPQDLEQELSYEGVCPDRVWKRWRSVVMRGHYE